ncbi:alpha/beta fold hydrolase [Streptomyces sp. NRRL F-5123]|uniref:alpha/beta fold hydrolase n=1 Tax=Streptomyces sp. NRRL F-5123 TaxID=1463856 RepID=UPI0004E24762|nr:alpha/beta fold hydrolase [Streptomyces sp. NRRL F-5123]
MAVGTAFVLVPGLHTGGWIWQDVAERLREAGAEALPLTLSGMDGSGAGADVEAHVADVLRAVETTDAEQVVLVGHCYGVHPVVAAADRLPERVARIVLLDTPMPQDGDPPAALVPEQALRERLLRRIAGSEGSEGEAAPGVAADATAGGTSAPLSAPEGAEAGPGGASAAPGAATQGAATPVPGGPAQPAGSEPPGGPGPSSVRARGADVTGDGVTGEASGGDEPGAPLPPPSSAQAWGALGSLAGVGAEAREQLVRRGVPQPWGTLARPLRLGGNAGAAGSVPVSGVLCAGNGSTLAMVEGALALGDPRYAYLAAPHMSYLEMATGHWPMLAEPDATAEVLLRAAAGEGVPPKRPAKAGRPAHLRPFLLDVPERPRERLGRVDLHLPDGDGPHPAVVLVHGGPVPEGAEPTPRDWPGFLGYARLLAGRGAVGAVVDHRLHGLGDFDRAADDVAEAVAAVRAHPRVDADRVALWFFSVGGLLSAEWLAAPPPWLRCVALTYPLLAPLPAWGVSGPRFHPAEAVRAAGRLPVVLTRVGRESPEFAATVEDFRKAAGAAGVDVQLVDVPSAVHGFETPDHSGEARAAVTTATRAVLARLA